MGKIKWTEKAKHWMYAGIFLGAIALAFALEAIFFGTAAQ